MAQFPGALATLATNKTDGTTTAGDHAGHHNSVADEVNAIETELGINPSGTFVDVVTRFNARLTVRKSADQTVSSTTANTALTDLSFAVTAGNDYTFRFIIHYTSAATTNNVGIGLTCPALNAGGYLSARVSIWGRAAVTAGTQGSTTSALGVYEAWIQGTGGRVASDAVATTGTVYPAIVEGTLSNPSANGTLQLQGSNEVSTANGNVFKKGSYGEIYIN